MFTYLEKAEHFKIERKLTVLHLVARVGRGEEPKDGDDVEEEGDEGDDARRGVEVQVDAALLPLGPDRGGDEAEEEEGQGHDGHDGDALAELAAAAEVLQVKEALHDG